MCRGIKNNTEEAFDGIFNNFNSYKGDLLSENESEDDIWSQRGQLHVIMTIRRPSLQKRADKYKSTSGPTNATKRQNAPHQPLVNNNGNGAERGFEWQHYSFEDPYNPESDQIFRTTIYKHCPISCYETPLGTAHSTHRFLYFALFLMKQYIRINPDV